MPARDAGPTGPQGDTEQPLFWEPTHAFLKYSVAFMVVGGALAILTLRIFQPEQVARQGMVASFVVIGLVSGALLRAGRPRASFLTQALGVWTYVTVAALIFGGVNAVSVYIYPLLILMIGWLAQPRGALVLASLTSALLLAFTVGELQGTLPAAPATTPVLRWVVESAVIFLAGVLAHRVRHSYRDRIEEVRQLGVHLNDRNAEVLAREAQLEAILASTSEGILAVDPEGRVIRTNRRFAELWSIPEPLVASRDDRALLDFVLGQLVDPDGFMATVQALYQSDTQSTDFVSFTDGRVFERFTAPLLLEGRRAGRIWCFRDITNTRRAEERLQLAMEVTQVVPFEVDLLAGALIFEPNGLTRLGLADRDDLRTFRGWADAVHPYDRDRFTEAVQHGFGPGDPAFDCEYRMPSAGGSWEWVHTRARVIQHASNGTPSRAVGSSMNISARKRLEQAHLQAQKLASLGTLAGGISHDFNNILAAIRGNVDEAALATGPGHQVAENLRDIRRSTDRAAELVRRIMTFARPKETQPERVSLHLVVLEVLKLLRSTLPASIELRTRFAGDIPDVMADSTQVHEVVVNLTTNAAHAIGSRAGAITYGLEPVLLDATACSAMPGAAPGRYLRLTVTDDGCGMEPTTMERIFDAFYTTKAVGEGTGLGLSMVHGIMRSHGGAVTVESTPGAGSSFALFFPIPELPPVPAPAPEPHAAVQVASLRVLLVDDEPMLVALGTRMLARLGHETTAFQDPRAALEALRANPAGFDFLITDYAMPRMTGTELTRAVLAIRPDLPVVLVTGRISEDDRRLLEPSGIRELILKPFGMDQLARAIERAAGRRARPPA